MATRARLRPPKLATSRHGSYMLASPAVALAVASMALRRADACSTCCCNSLAIAHQIVKARDTRSARMASTAASARRRAAAGARTRAGPTCVLSDRIAVASRAS
eukprot:scaffold3120_cov26-Tisochrysis_lutea.AAC.2